MKPTTDRRKLYAALHAAAAKAGLDDDAYRQMLVARTGQDSAKKLSDDQIRGVLDHLNGGRRPGAGTRKRAESRVAGKIRALWLSLYNLGVVRDPGEKAMAAYVKRMAGVDALQWIDNHDAQVVIEALKEWATREARVFWELYDTPQQAVIAAQLARLRTLAEASPTARETLEAFATPEALGADDRQRVAVIAKLGNAIRTALAEGGASGA